MKDISRLIAGWIFFVGGIFLTVISFFVTFVFLVYSLPLIFISLWMLLNKSEDRIEQRKDIKIKGANK